MNYIPFLRRIWLTEIESKTYIILLENWPSTIAEIAKATGFHRQMIYRVLPVLQESKLVSTSITGKRRLYTAESPTHLKAIVDKLSTDFDSILPSMEELYTPRNDQPLIKYYSWAKGITFLFDDVIRTLKKWEIFYRYSSRKASEDSPKNYFSDATWEMREKKQLERILITNEWLSKYKKSRLDREVVTIPKDFDLFEDNISKVIYGSKVWVVDYNSENAFIIENEKYASFERKVFKLLFKLLSEKE
ncbi:MAG: Transcriptional regulator, TrmB [uncultured bacterium (gcode 4)]|uniref:Transcriptional regulator, TrmB n=1 Tax=uncultured bacterium (gcode 4) TaxID=1234023 RepID=K2GIL8_9BACT|nr:MAG: Transcriptional regulator, TrmB [uncultured bacterium (gcode 4)]